MIDASAGFSLGAAGEVVWIFFGHLGVQTMYIPQERGCGRKLGPNSWNEVQVMYTQKEINDVLKIYDRLNSLRGTVQLLGYPSLIEMT